MTSKRPLLSLGTDSLPILTAEHLHIWSSFVHIPMEQPLKFKYSLLDHSLLMLENLIQILLAAFELEESDA